jgi:hypothetical protein
VSIRLEDILLLSCFGAVVWELEFVWIKACEIEVSRKGVVVVVVVEKDVDVAGVYRGKSYRESFPINARYSFCIFKSKLQRR